MNRLVVRSRVDADGVLRVVVPVGAAEAERVMQVTIESIPESVAEQDEYADWLDSIAGQWQGEFERLPKGQFERRESL